jgi:hypothetical protein
MSVVGPGRCALLLPNGEFRFSSFVLFVIDADDHPTTHSHPHLSFIVEDQAQPIEQAKLNFAMHTSQHPELKGRLDARVQNFFEPQGEGGIGGDGFGFMMKWIL